MVVNKYRVLLEVAKTHNMGKVGQKLMYSQQGISKIIKRLEKELGFPLVVKQRDGIKLTSYAEELLPHVEKLVQAENEVLGAAYRIKEDISGRNDIRIGLAHDGSHIYYTLKIESYLKSCHPEYNVKLVNADSSEELIAMLLSRKIDCAIMNEVKSDNIEFVPLYKKVFCAVIEQSSDFITKNELLLDDFKDSILAITADNPWIEELSEKCKSLIVVKNDFAVIAMASTGTVIGILPLHYSCGKGLGIEARGISDMKPQICGIIMRPDEPEDSSVRSLIDPLKEIIDRDCQGEYRKMLL